MELFPRPTNVEYAQILGIIVMFLLGKSNFQWLAKILIWFIKLKGIKVDLGKDVKADFKDGKIVVEIPGKVELAINVKALLLPEIEKIEAKVMSGEIDLVKGTDLDKMAILTVIGAIKVELSK